MGEQRNERIWAKRGGDTQGRAKSDENPWLTRPIGECWDEARRIDGERVSCQYDFCYLYDNYLARPVRNRKTKQMEMQALGRVHLLMRDFLTCERWDETQTYTNLREYAPDRDEFGDFPECWIYYRTLDCVPLVCMGPDNPIASMFYGKFWQGVVIRLCGDGFIKCLLAPRGHLKSHVAGMYDTLFKTIQHPEERNVIKSVTGERATIFLDGIKYHWEQNLKFMDIFGHLKPEKREAAWNTEMVQLLCANRRGPDKTIVSSGMESDKTGSHGDNYLNDDIAGESNTLTAALRAKARGVIEKQQAQCDPGSNLTDVGTRWEEDDPHVMFVGKPDGGHSGSLSDYSSFMVVTVLDGDESAKCSTRISPLGYGKPIWSERWTMKTVEQKRAGMPDDRFWCGQYFNQFHGTTNRVFSKAWIENRYELQSGESTLDFARRLRLNITIGGDTASGLPTASQRAKRDDTALWVEGQTPDRTKSYFLDGLCEKLPVEDIATAFVDVAMKWYANTKPYGGTFRVGYEKTKWEKLIGPAIDAEQRRRGSDSIFPIELLSHGNAPKVERIRVLAKPYRDGAILWPKSLVVNSYKGAEPYDLCEIAEAEFTNYNPYATRDNLLDAHAYAHKIAQPAEYTLTVEETLQRAREMTDANRVSHPGDMTREAVENEAMQPSLGGYEGFVL